MKLKQLFWVSHFIVELNYWIIEYKIKFEKTAHAYFGRPYFSKSFGGKIQNFQTDVNKTGKFYKTEQLFTKTTMECQSIKTNFIKSWTIVAT